MSEDNVYHRLGRILMLLADMCKDLMEAAPEDEDITLLADTRDWALDRATVFYPTGEPEEGYPKDGGCQFFNIEAERAKRRSG